MPDSSRPRPDPRPEPTLAAQPCLGRIVAIEDDGRPRVGFAGLVGSPPIARVLGSVSREQLEAARLDARPILLSFLEGRADSPVIVSLASMADLPPPELPPEEEIAVEVDGEAIEREVIEAKDKLVLRCGAASITLEADGTVRVIGRDITSWARRRHRIRGGSVAIN